LFLASSKVARQERIPRNFIAGNSGVPLGIASDARDLPQVRWVDPSDPVRCFNDLTISQREAEGIKGSITTGRVLENGKVNFRA
jgi:hypothetical protein